MASPPRSRRGRTTFLLREPASPDQTELQVITNAILAALEYSPVMRAPRYHGDVYAHVSREIERRFWKDIYVSRPEAREILYTLDTGQVVLVTGERGTGKSTAILAVVNGHEPQPPLAASGHTPRFLPVVFDANRHTEKLRDVTRISTIVHRAIYDDLLAQVTQRLERDEDGHGAWRAWLYEHDTAFELFRSALERDQIPGQSPDEWLYLARQEEYAELLAEGEREFKDAEPVDRLTALLAFVGARTAYEPLLVIDNLDHLGHDSARLCCEVLHGIMTSTSHRVRGAVAVRPETADALEQRLDTGVKPAPIPITRRPLNPNEHEQPSTELTLRFLEKRLAVLQEPETVAVIRGAIDAETAARLAGEAELTDDRDVAVYLDSLMELLELIFYDLFRPDEPDDELRRENWEFGQAVHYWHNGSLRDCGLSLAWFAADILQEKSHVYRLRQLLKSVYLSRERDSLHRRRDLRRVARSLLYRHLLFWAASPEQPLSPPRNVMVFDANEEATNPPIHFLRLRILQYLAKRQRGISTVANLRSDLARIDVPPERVDAALVELAVKRSHDDAGLVRIDGFHAEEPDQRLRDGAIVRLLDAGRFLVDTLYTTTEYLFWSAVNTPEAARAVRLPKPMTSDHIHSDSFRTAVATRFLQRHLIAKFADEHPFLRGFSKEWTPERARRHLRKYEDLFGFSRSRWFLTRAERSIRAFIPAGSKGELWAEARDGLDEIRKLGQMLDAVMDSRASSQRG
jgi:energy-coupling factor transporter ATP-binding protein EcfA2